MSQGLKSGRIESIDVLRGLVMVIMALDHVRDFFHFGAFSGDPTDLETTTPILFMTRFVTHFCAPTFIFLTGTSASLYGQNKSKKELSKFLFTRGLMLIFVEIVIMNFLWWFNPAYEILVLQVIWAIGVCMIVLSGLIYMPVKWLIPLSFAAVFGHNLLDGITTTGSGFSSVFWYIIHQQQFLFSEGRMIAFVYPVLPWFAVMALGYCFGFFYHKSFDAQVRKKYLLILGASILTLFLIVRGVNVYGDMTPWQHQQSFLFTVFSFINVTKYPPSLLYLLITLGPIFFVLYFLDDYKSKTTDVLIVFGRVPFFYYLLHVFVIHSFALIILAVRGEDWRLMIFTQEHFTGNKMADYGYSLGIVYLVWILVVFFLYPFSYKYMKYKLSNKEKWWLSYL